MLRHFAIMDGMIITYFGRQFFKIQQGDMVLAFNPISKQSKNEKGGAIAHFGADIALITTRHPDYNGEEQLSHGDRMPFIISGPGDYEIKEIFIKGILSDANISGKKYINTIYALTVDNINIVFLGALADEEISKDAQEAINGPDILFVPIAGDGMLGPKAAAKLASSLEPKMIIPMDYDEASLKLFLKETGEEKTEPQEKLTLKLKDLEGHEGKVAVLSVM